MALACESAVNPALLADIYATIALCLADIPEDCLCVDALAAQELMLSLGILRQHLTTLGAVAPTLALHLADVVERLSELPIPWKAHHSLNRAAEERQQRRVQETPSTIAEI
jgi:hypothetical protein